MLHGGQKYQVLYNDHVQQEKHWLQRFWPTGVTLLQFGIDMSRFAVCAKCLNFALHIESIAKFKNAKILHSSLESMHTISG